MIIGFAIDNSASVEAYTSRSGWGAALVSEADWDAGVAADFDFGDPWFVTGDTPGIGVFDSFFGPAATQANLYWLSRHFGIPIVSFETAGDFFFDTVLLESDLTLFLSPTTGGGPVIAMSATPANNVPEPMTLSLLGAGLLGAWGDAAAAGVGPDENTFFCHSEPNARIPLRGILRCAQNDKKRSE